MDKENVENKNTFQAIKNYSNIGFNKNNKNSFSKAVIIPFFSGIIGCSLVIGTCFGVPSIKEKLLGTSNSQPAGTLSTGTGSYVSLSEYSDTSVYAANKILPSIVGIEIEYSVNSIFSMFGNGGSSTAKASGSGIIISENGYILTNNHVVDSSQTNSFYELSSANKVTVSLYNSDKKYEGKIVGRDSQTDLAVIKIEAEGLTAAEFADSDTIKVGEFAMAVGNPLGLGSSTTTGIISALNRKITDSDGKSYTLIQTDAAINSGNSGGALVNSEGKVIGVNTMKVSSTGVEGMGFAIPINSTVDITDQLIQYKKVKRPYIGISGIDLDEQTAKSNNLVVGVYVKSIDDFSAAEKAGLKPGDVIVEADGKTIKTMDELNEIKNKHSIGDEIKIVVNRDGKKVDITITLGEQP
ncbi:MAG: trypsin-like peptidase domain-containing protein [Clostridia bacterium]|nr:trypsin-like peptidase domain-containing protein [Clostridia bacterium]